MPLDIELGGAWTANMPLLLMLAACGWELQA